MSPIDLKAASHTVKVISSREQHSFNNKTQFVSSKEI